MQTETEITKTTALSSDMFQDVENLNGNQSDVIFHVTFSVNFKGTKCNSNGFSYDREWSPKFETGLNIIIAIIQKV